MLSDEKLYENLLRGDMSAFDALYARYERPLFGFVLRHLGDRAEAEDVLHEVFMALLRERRTERKLGTVRAWAYEVARNLCLNRLRSRRRAATALEALAEEPPLKSALPDRGIEEREASNALHKAVARLPEPLAQLYELRARGLSYDELATTLTIPLGTVKSRMHEMLTRLREEMRHELPTD